MPCQVLDEQLGRRGDAVAPLRPVLRRILGDVQERLTFRAQAFIKVSHEAKVGKLQVPLGPAMEAHDIS